MSESLTQPLPCPFCGANDGLTMTDGSTYRWGYAYCSNCGASAGEVRRAYPDDGKWYEDAIQQWNKRAAPTPRKPEPYDQTELELCTVCGWKTLIPGDACLNCERDKPKQETKRETILDRWRASRCSEVND